MSDSLTERGKTLVSSVVPCISGLDGLVTSDKNGRSVKEAQAKWTT